VVSIWCGSMRILFSYQCITNLSQPILWTQILCGSFLLCLSLGSATTFAKDDILSITLDSAELIQIDTEITVVQVGNPEIANVSVNTPQSIFVSGLTIGETGLLLLDGAGEIVLDLNVVVVPKNERHVTVHRGSSTIQTLICHPRCLGVENPGIVIE